MFKRDNKKPRTFVLLRGCGITYSTNKKPTVKPQAFQLLMVLHIETSTFRSS